MIPRAISFGTLYDLNRAIYNQQESDDYPHVEYDYSTDDYNNFEYQQNQAELINGDNG